jgi:hypothetical protein
MQPPQQQYSAQAAAQSFNQPSQAFTPPVSASTYPSQGNAAAFGPPTTQGYPHQGIEFFIVRVESLET